LPAGPSVVRSHSPLGRNRRLEAELEQRTDILSLIMRASTEEGQTLTDMELRD
jgi:cytochrome P450